MKNSIFKDYGFAWVTGFLFLFSLAGHWLFGWFAYLDEQAALHSPIEVKDYSIEMLRDTFENWQSEFLQLLWQVGGLAYLLHVGSPASKEGDDRAETKIDALLLQIGSRGEEIIRKIDNAYEGRHTDPFYKNPVVTKADFKTR